MPQPPDMFCGIEMTAEGYDDARALRAYTHKHFPHLMTPLERRVTEYTAPIVSDAADTKIRKVYQFLESRDGHVDDAAVYTAFQTPYEQRIELAVNRVIAQHRAEIIENRCPACHRLVRTPVARQCLWCGFDWHDG